MGAGIGPRLQETPTALEKLIYYPYRWVFQYVFELRSSVLVDLAVDNRLLGNLAHQMVQGLLNE
ncbi:MAG: PD-(D/E)XK nuclease family protein, partial [Lewinella sp.]|nr:PD-(D/E)XK nuclease family protein [Lewinella sp.]